jgi:hypothetical protein
MKEQSSSLNCPYKLKNMMKQMLFKLIAIFSLTFYATTSVAQQSRVDSAIMYLNKSFATDKLDSVSSRMVDTLLNGAVLSDSQIAQIETALSRFKNWENKLNLYSVRVRILQSLFNSDVNKAISYGKKQIEQLDKINTPEASIIKARFLNGLRIPFRNSNRLEDGFQFYTKKLNDYKIKNDSFCIAECYYVLGGFYRISGMIDLAIYNMKKSISYIDSAQKPRAWANNIGVLGYYYYLKGDADECIRYNRMANVFYLKQKSGYGIPT